MRITKTGSGATARIDDLTFAPASRVAPRAGGSGALARVDEQDDHRLTLRLSRMGGSGAKAVLKE